MDWYTRYIFQMINKVQTDNIKAFEIKEEAVKDLYDHTHELMKRLAWSSRRVPSHVPGSEAILTLHSMPLMVQKRQDPWPSHSHLSWLSATLFRDAQNCPMGGLRLRL